MIARLIGVSILLLGCSRGAGEATATSPEEPEGIIVPYVAPPVAPADASVPEPIKPRPRMVMRPRPTDDQTRPKMGDVARKIKLVYMKHLRACHKADPLQGTVAKLVFTIGPRGTVTNAILTGASATKTLCIEARVRRWRFRRARDSAGEPTSLTFSIKLAFQPKPKPKK